MHSKYPVKKALSDSIDVNLMFMGVPMKPVLAIQTEQ